MLLPRKLTAQLAATLAGALWMAVTASVGPALADGLELRGAGSTLAAPLYGKWIAAFGKSNSSMILKYAAVGSGAGVELFKAGAVDFGASDVPLTLDRAAKIDGGVVQIPSTAGMVVLAYNLPGMTGALSNCRRMSMSTYSRAVFTTGTTPEFGPPIPN